MASDASGALVIFVLLGAFYRAQRHRPITAGTGEQRDFVATKKLVGLLLFLALGITLAYNRFLPSSAPASGDASTG